MIDLKFILPCFVSGLFFTIGFFMIYGQIMLRKVADEIMGEVIGIERYTSRTHTSNGRRSSKQTFYRPIVEFSHLGETYKIGGASVSHIRHRLYEKIPVLIYSGEDQNIIKAEPKDSVNFVIGFILLIFSLGVMAFIHLQLGASLQMIALITSILLFLGNLFYNHTRNQVTFHSFKPQKDSFIIDTMDEQDTVYTQSTKSGYIIAIILLFFGIYLTLQGYHILPEDAQSIVKNDILSFAQEILDKAAPDIWTRGGVLIGAGLFSIFCALYSMIWTAKTYKLQ